MFQKTYHTVSDVAELLSLHPKTVLKKIQSGELEASKVGRQYRITEAQLQAFSGETKPEHNTQRSLLVSTVVDIDAISTDEGNRITNTLLAAVSQAGGGIRIDAVDYPELGKLKLIINTRDTQDTEHLLAMLGQLLEPLR
ncbi:helix-turn-helix domain-containing protein [Reinekea sp. G2M2-21]|uniref:helix-turn-helix domain-containing protein n=1 Tax=Reinekea sp. G2M2-21 TaxID=2788942 RepID=UPI0018A9366A